MMYLVEKNYGFETRKVFDNKDKAIEFAKAWAEECPEDYVNVVELTPCMPTIWSHGERPR